MQPNDHDFYEDFSRLNNELTTLQRDLVKKNIDLAVLNDKKNEFLGIAAHELRSPLGIILTYSDFLESECASELDADHIGFVRTIKKTSRYLLTLIDELLDVSLIESGRLRLDLRPADLNKLVFENVHMNRVLAENKGIQIVLHELPQISSIMLDENKIIQTLNNLLGNAIKYSFPGSVIEISARVENGFVVLAVKDQGQGIQAGDINKLFRPFSKANVKTTGGESAHGLGLYIVRRIVEGHGGAAWVESEFGKGSTFMFSLPM